MRRAATSQGEPVLPRSTDDSCTRGKKDSSGSRSVRWAFGLLVLLVFLCTAWVLLRLPGPAPPEEALGARGRHLVSEAVTALRPAPVARPGVEKAAEIEGIEHKETIYYEDPIVKWGGGKPVVMDPEFMYNRELADAMPLDRVLPDSRPEGCKPREAAMDIAKLPKTSVVIVSYNEAKSTLQRTVTSVLRHSPPELLEEIIIVDDCSVWEQAPQVKGMPKTRVIRHKKREGLMIARMNGFKAAVAETVTFLDSHIECIEGWLPPLLDEVARNSSTVISPVIDIIKDDTLKYVPAGAGMRGIFDWQLTFKWKPDDKAGKDGQPYLSPTHAGGLFTISKRYFEYLGLYDPGMHVWGYENIELSLRVWMCGGRLKIDPCSRVGHIFRSKSPLKNQGENYQQRNKFRTAAVWLDSYAKRILGNDPQDYGDISEQLAMRKKLQCHDFQWYLDNVFPDHAVLTHVTALKHKATKLCLDTLGRNEEGNEIGFYGCHGPDGNQRFEIDASEASQSKIKRAGTEYCVMPSSDTADHPVMVLGRCDSPRAEWFTADKGGVLRHVSSDRCLQILDEKAGRRVTVVHCDAEAGLAAGIWEWTCQGEAKADAGTKGLKEESTNFCVDSMARSSGDKASVWTCHHAGGNQAWSIEDWAHKPDAEEAPSDMAGAEAVLITNSEQELCLQVDPPVGERDKKLTLGNRNHKVLLRSCSECDGGTTAKGNTDCVWWHHGNRLQSRATKECLKIGRPEESADLEAGSCDNKMMSWDLSAPRYGLCHGDG